MMKRLIIFTCLGFLLIPTACTSPFTTEIPEKDSTIEKETIASGENTMNKTKSLTAEEKEEVVKEESNEVQADVVIDETEYQNKTYRAYKDRIVEVQNGIESVVYELDDSENEYGERLSEIYEDANFRFSPNGYILFFDYHPSPSVCKMNGIQLDINELLWSEEIGCRAEIIWSPDNKQVAFAWNHFDGLFISVSKFGNIKSLDNLLEVYYPSEHENTKFYWKDDNTFVFEPNEDYFQYISDSFKAEGLELGINEFIVR